MMSLLVQGRPGLQITFAEQLAQSLETTGGSGTQRKTGRRHSEHQSALRASSPADQRKDSSGQSASTVDQAPDMRLQPAVTSKAPVGTPQRSTSESDSPHRRCGCLSDSACASARSNSGRGADDSACTKPDHSGGGAHDGRREASHQASTSDRDSLAGYAWTLPADTSSRQCVWLWVRP